MNAQASPAAAAAPRFTKIGEDGALLPADATDWVAVLDTRTNLMWDVKARPVKNYAGALKVPGKLTVAGFKDWRLPTVEELFLLADRTRVRPAIDTDFFPDTPSDWFWTSTLWASSPSDDAWSVYFGNGSSYWGSQSYEGFVRAVRPGQ
ncbi:MAG: Lcl C-terminal domain-containing protein [Steroidobacteraceae bacterium]